MRRYHQKVFDDFVQGTTAVYSDSQSEDKLGEPDFAILSAVVSDASASGTLALTVTQEDSPDRVYWMSSSNTPIEAEQLTSGTVEVFGGQIYPATGFLRLRIELAGTSPKARLALYVTGRDQNTRGPAS